MRLIVNIDGWYVPGLAAGGIPKGKIIDTDAIKEIGVRERVLHAFNSGETGRCPKEGNIVPVLLRKVDESEIVDYTLDRLKDFVGEEAVDQDDIEEFKAKMRASVDEASAPSKSEEIEDEEEPESEEEEKPKKKKKKKISKDKKDKKTKKKKNKKD